MRQLVIIKHAPTLLSFLVLARQPFSTTSQFRAHIHTYIIKEGREERREGREGGVD